MPGEVGFYLRNRLPASLARSRKLQRWFSNLFKNQVTLPLSLLAIAPYLEKEGFNVVIIDGRIEDARLRIAEELDGSVLYVGISALTGSMIAYGLYCAEVVRQTRPDVPIVWGGVHVTLSPEQSLATSPYVDIVVRGEGELTAAELAKALSTGSSLASVKGISWKSGGGIVHNPDRELMDFSAQLPLNYDLLRLDRYDTKDILLYQSERGCPHRCAFCDVVIVHRRKYRHKGVDNVLRDFEYLAGKFQPRKIQLVDDCFFADLKRAGAIMEGLIRLNLGVQWHASCRVQYTKNTDVAFWERARESGLSEVYVGAESASQRILDYIKKDCTVEDIYKSAEQITSSGILMWTNFMTGFPGETREDLLKTVEMIDQLGERYGSKIRIGRIFMYAPCPGTPLHSDVVDAGYEPPRDLAGWGAFRIGDLSHTTWHPDARFIASASICSKYGRNREGMGVSHRMRKGFHKYGFVEFMKLVILKTPELLRSLLGERAHEKWIKRDFRYTWDIKLLRHINLIFDSW